MKHGIVVGLAFIMVLYAAGAFAAQPLGGPAEAERGHFSLSAGYFYSKDRWDSNTLSGDFKIQTSRRSNHPSVAAPVPGVQDVHSYSGCMELFQGFLARGTEPEVSASSMPCFSCWSDISDHSNQTSCHLLYVKNTDKQRLKIQQVPVLFHQNRSRFRQ